MCSLSCYGAVLYLTVRYRDRYWRESTFDGVELVQRTLDEVYGKGKVSLVQAVFRWMNHHSQLKESGKELSMRSMGGAQTHSVQ